MTVRARAGDATKPVGSGVVLKSDRVITAAHLLNGATEVVVSTTTGDVLAAKVVGTDPQTDLALLAVSGDDLQLAPLGSSSPPRVGQTVVAVTVRAAASTTRSASTSSPTATSWSTPGTGIDVAGLLETGISVTPDMAGGALVDPDGSLVGILTHPAQSGPDGLAIPVAAVRDVRGPARRGRAGRSPTAGSACCATRTPPTRPGGGARSRWSWRAARRTRPGSQPGDVVVRADGSPVSGRPDLVAAVRSLRPQDPLDLQYERDGRTRNATVNLGGRRPGRARVLAGDGVNPPIARSPRSARP